MLRKQSFSALILALAIGTGALALAPVPVYAAEKAISSKEVLEPLAAGQKLLDSDPKAALAKFDEAAAHKKSDYDDLIINQLRAAAYQKLNDGANMAAAAEAVLHNPECPPEKVDTFKGAALQGYLTSGNLEKAAQYAKGNPDLEAQLAEAYVNKGQYSQGEALIKEVIGGAGGKPKSEWVILLYNAQAKNGETEAATETIQGLLVSDPKPEYWNVVLGNLANRGSLSDAQRLDVYRLMLATDSLSGSGYAAMAQTAMRAHSPGDAKTALEKGEIKGAQLANATKQSADDKAVLPQVEAKAAAESNGDTLASVGEGYLSYGQNEKAASVLQRAIAKGVSDPAAAKLHLGIAYARAGQSDKARAAWSSVSGKGVTKQLASLWPLTLR